MFRRQKSPEPGEFAAEVLQHLEALYATAMRLTRNRADAEDLVQDALVRALRFADRFTPGTNLKAWLYTILHNAWRNQRRDALRDPVAADSAYVDEAASLPGGPSELETPEQVLLRGTLDADLQAALDDLPDAFRQAVWLRDVEEFSYAEIAGMLGVPIGTVMSRISRGRRQLFQRLGKPGQFTGPASEGRGKVAEVERTGGKVKGEVQGSVPV
jgi:RNA polymerase sigma-70 factor (ECF subfamily)